MNLYIENKSPSFVATAFERVVTNTKKTVEKGIAVNRRPRFDSRTYHFFRKRQVYDIEYVIFHTRALRRAVKFLNRKKRPIGLTLVVSKALTKRDKRLLDRARRTVKVVDDTGREDNLAYYRQSKYVLYRAGGENTLVAADVMHLTKFDETLYGCRFSSCLGQYLYVDAKGKVFFCPEHKENSLVGTLEDEENYFKSERILEVLRQAVEKRKSCKAECPHFSLCNGACPLEEGCADFPALMQKHGEEIDRLVASKTDLATLHYAVGYMVLKDAIYAE